MKENGPVDKRAAKEKRHMPVRITMMKSGKMERPFSNISVHTNIHI